MKLLSLFTVLAISLFSSVSAFAANGVWSGVTITGITTYTAQGASPNGALYFITSANGTTPQCSVHNQVYVDTTTPDGAFLAQQLQLAALDGHAVTITGSGACFGGSGSEYVAYLSYTAP